MQRALDAVLVASNVRQFEPLEYVVTQVDVDVSKTYVAVEHTQSVISSLPVSVNVVEIETPVPGQDEGRVSVAAYTTAGQY